MIKFNLLFFIFFLSCSAPYSIKRNVSIECYVAALHANYGFDNGGVFNFELKRRAVTVPYEDRSYTLPYKLEKVHELYYFKDKISAHEFEDLFLGMDTIPIESMDFNPLMMIAKISKVRDTLFVNHMEIVKFRNKYYFFKGNLKDYIMQKLPRELQDSWIKHLPER